jgi:hypothetical protein
MVIHLSQLCVQELGTSPVNPPNIAMVEIVRYFRGHTQTEESTAGALSTHTPMFLRHFKISLLTDFVPLIQPEFRCSPLRTSSDRLLIASILKHPAWWLNAWLYTTHQRTLSISMICVTVICMRLLNQTKSGERYDKETATSFRHPSVASRASRLLAAEAKHQFNKFGWATAIVSRNRSHKTYSEVSIAATNQI